MRPKLDAEQTRTLAERLAKFLRTGDLPSVDVKEREPNIVRKALVPAIAAELKKLGIEGLTLEGEGLSLARPTVYLGSNFYPDVAVLDLGTRAIAIEVKKLDGPSRQSKLATALGQATIYKLTGYAQSIVFLTEDGHNILPVDLRDTLRLHDVSQLPLVVYRPIVGNVFTITPAHILGEG